MATVVGTPTGTTTLKLELGTVSVTAEVAPGAVRGKLAVSVSVDSGLVKMRLLKVAAPAFVPAVWGVVARSIAVSVTVTVADPAVNGLPLSVRVTTGAGEMAKTVTALDGGWVVKASA
jgi:hypothetical protein